jgi:hypothetical protein
VSFDSENIIAGIATSGVNREFWNKAIENSGASDEKHKFWIVHVEDPEYQWGPYAVGVTSEINTNLKDKVSIDLLTPAVAVMFKTEPYAEFFREGNNVSLFPGPSCRLDAQALTFRTLQITTSDDLALPKLRIEPDFLDAIEQAFDKRRRPKRRFDKISGGKKLVQKDGAIFWLNNKCPLIGIALSKRLHRFQGDFIPVSI